MQKITCTNRECRARVPFHPRQHGQRVACPACRNDLLLPAAGAQEPSATELGRPLALPLAAVGGVVAVVACALLLGTATVSGRLPGHFQRQLLADKQDAPGGRGTGLTTAVEPGAGEVVSLPGKGRRRALLVGVKDYEGDLRTLKYTEDDVTALQKVLKLADYDTTVMTGSAATAAAVRAKFDELVASCTPEDLFLVAFAGHGVEQNRTFYFCPAGAQLNAPATLVSMNEVYQKLEGCRAGAKFVFSDACRNDPNPDGRGTLKVESLDEYKTVGAREQQVTPSRNVQAFYSCSAGEFSYEPDEYKHGVFFFHLIRALQGDGDLDRDGKITFPEVQLYVSKKVSGWALDRRRVQRPNAKGDTNTITPLAAWTVGASTELVGTQALRDDPNTLLYEDFANVRAALPAGWSGAAFTVRADGKTMRGSLQSARPKGLQYIRLPIRKPLAGDFTLRLDAELGEVANSTPQVLEVRILGQQGAVVPVEMTGHGACSIGGRDPQKPQAFQKFKPNTFELIRESGVYVLRVNGAAGPRAGPEYAGPVEEVWLGLSGGTYGELKGKVFAVAVTQPPGDAPASAGVPTQVVVHEEFGKEASGSTLPAGWDGADFQIAFDDTNQRPCLQKNRPDLSFAALPPVDLPGDFSVEVEYSLSYVNNGHPHAFHLRLEGATGAGAVVVNTAGRMKVFAKDEEDDRKRRAEHHQVCRLRLVRLAGAYKVYWNDEFVENAAYPNFPVKAIKLGLVGGKYGDYPPARVYSVRVTSFGRAAAPVPSWVRQDFTAAKRNEAAPGWPEAGALIVRGDDYQGWVELAAASPGSNGTTNILIPAGDFTLTATVHLIRQPDSVVFLGWGAGKSAFSFTLNGHGEWWVLTKPKTPARIPLTPNRGADKIELKRTGKVVTIRVNGQPATAAPVEIPAGAFRVGMTRGTGDPSPRIVSLELTQP